MDKYSDVYESMIAVLVFEIQDYESGIRFFLATPSLSVHQNNCLLASYKRESRGLSSVGKITMLNKLTL